MKAKKSKNPNSPLKISQNSAENLAQKPVEKSLKKSKKSANMLFLVGILWFIGGIVLMIAGFIIPSKNESVAIFPEIPSKKISQGIYSHLTGLPVDNEVDLTAPTYCIQTPNGMDGARPQAGINQAGVIFEAIAEAGITRFAAIYQNPTAAIIGPIRSLRLYYLEWDTPFDCIIVHAGGAPDALQAVARGGYKDLTENYTYMYRGTYGNRRWNNLFTTSNYLAKMNTDRNYGGSNIKGFTRLTPEKAENAKIDTLAEEKLIIYEPSTGKTSNLVAKVPNIAIDFGRMPNFNVRYKYDLNSNTYLRSYESEVAHDVYDCPSTDLGKKNPEDSCTLKQLAPTVVVAMIVQEKLASDDYHQDITTTGSGTAYIFQNGGSIKGTWKKSSAAEQIRFYNPDGSEIALIPGQTFVEAVPQYGSVKF